MRNNESAMRLKVIPGDFVVSELADLALLPESAWAVYRVRKVLRTTLEVQTELASCLHVPPAQVVFPALKDREAISIQFATLPRGLPEVLEGPGYEAQRIGYRARPLSPQDLRGNAFDVVVRALSPAVADALQQALQTLAEIGLPNYFGAQRFGSRAGDWGFVGKAILQRDAQGAVQAYLTRPFAGDPAPVGHFKRAAQSLWPDWPAIMAIAPRPSNFRSVLTYLQDHPTDFRRALNLVPQRVLSIYLAAYQSHLWNLIADAWLRLNYAQEQVPSSTIAIADVPLAYHRIRLANDALVSGSLPLPSHRATFQPPHLARIVADILEEEGLTANDLKARILTRAYLPQGQRHLLLWPRELAVDEPQPDERFAGNLKLRVRFALPSGSYATVLLDVAQAMAQPAP